MLIMTGAAAITRHGPGNAPQATASAGIQSIGVNPVCGISSPHHNPFVALKRPETTEVSGPSAKERLG